MIRDLHTHSYYSDGKASPEEMVLAAINKGLGEIGLSDHSYTFFDESYCMKKDKIASYKAELAALKKKYAGQISVLCGVEQDAFSVESTEGYDYVIGSAHYLKVNGKYYPVDEKAADFESLCQNGFGGDYYALAEEYFGIMANFAEREDVSIIGHFDLITKFNEGGRLFNENHPRYLSAAKAAMDKLLAAGKTFEINTGAMARGYRSVPYPAPTLLMYLRGMDGRTILSSDAHTPQNIAFAFDRFREE